MDGSFSIGLTLPNSDNMAVVTLSLLELHCFVQRALYLYHFLALYPSFSRLATAALCSVYERVSSSENNIYSKTTSTY